MWSNKTWDGCGVCGGDNSSCMGCDGQLNSRKVYDPCGVCGGNMSCVACDGVMWSGTVVDVCGKCGGNATGNATACNADTITTSLIVTGTVIGVTLFVALAAVIAFFLYKHLMFGANWYIPNVLAGEDGEVGQRNPIYDGGTHGHENPGYEKKEDSH
eukprot:TRINITY_DN650_c0_g1_i5.p4 TRINITY_DN650_c0_g1~~TRINITY_DN650_c0_g1_i5.p4  ORF type:complete len:157 (-),score=63.33 TRINITY_DN650_c0_g1_i5:112-582(-)